MRDHLDDPTPPSGDRAAVAARAGQLRLRRRLAVAGTGTTTVVALVVALALVGRGPDARRPSVVSLASPSATPSELPSETASPSATATPAPTASPSLSHPADPDPVGAAATPTSPTPSPTSCESTKYEECRDGKSGYGEGDSLNTCRNRTAVPSGDRTADLTLGASLELVLPASVKAQGESRTPGPSGDLIVHNDGSQRLRFALRPDSGNDDDPNTTPGWDGLVRGTAEFGGVGYATFEPSTIYRDLEPGGTVTFPVFLETEECGDTQDDLDTPLPPGDYQLGFDVIYHVEPVVDAGPTPTAEPTSYEAATLGGTLHIT